MNPFSSPAVAAHFQSYPVHVRDKLLTLRELIFTVAADTEGVGELEETLKWGEPAYLTAQSKSGSTVRMDWKAKRPDQCAIYFNCNTDLIETFRTLFPNDFKFEGRRAIVLNLADRIRMDELAFCLAASLTYHANKRSKASLRRSENGA